jgi:hypothetical protein
MLIVTTASQLYGERVAQHSSTPDKRRLSATLRNAEDTHRQVDHCHDTVNRS